MMPLVYIQVEGQAPKLTAALAKMFKVGPKQVAFSGVTGQSSLLNHQVSAKLQCSKKGEAKANKARAAHLAAPHCCMHCWSVH